VELLPIRAPFTQATDMTETPVSITFVNHLSVDIAVPADVVWREIVDSFVEARRWRETGYAIEPIDDRAAVLGGYRMRLERDDAATDERVVRVTERDDVERRLSLFVDFSSAPDGLVVHATYGARAMGAGARYTIDCYTQMGIRPAGTGSAADIAAAIDEMKNHSGKYLTDYLGGVKSRLEQVQGEIR
jgi:hypothetical protein